MATDKDERSDSIGWAFVSCFSFFTRTAFTPVKEDEMKQLKASDFNSNKVDLGLDAVPETMLWTSKLRVELPVRHQN